MFEEGRTRVVFVDPDRLSPILISSGEEDDSMIDVDTFARELREMEGDSSK